MDWELPFTIAGQVAVAGWAILIFAPRRWPALNLVPGAVLPAILSLGYAGLVLVYFAGTGGGFGSLAEVRTLLSTEPMLLAGWIHYLAFDLFVGAWIARRADRIGLSRLVQAPILVTTFMLGPIGLLLFLILAPLWTTAARNRLLEA